MSREEMHRYCTMQIAEIEKHKYFLGLKLGYDPLRDRTMNDIAREWIVNYGENFRAYWESCCRGNIMGNPTGSGNPFPKAA